MLNVAVELGTYSVKFISYQQDKKGTKLLSTDEVILDFSEVNLDEIDYDYTWKMQLDIVSQYLEKIHSEYLLTISLPGDIITTRYLSLPVKNKKKANQLLPFQIEEDIPFSLSECHWAERLKPEGPLMHATVGIIKKELFDEFYQQLMEYKIEPQALTSDVSAYAQMIEQHESDFEQTFAIIDVGHHVTRGYIFQDGLLVSNHQSFVAGQAINESISKTYDISDEEATIYKHQNSFFLIEDQYDQVNDNQKEFAKVMDSTMMPLISEIRRWDIGHRVKYGSTIKTIYLCGGSSNVKNIQNYFSEKMGIPVKFFDPYKYLDTTRIDHDQKFLHKYASLTTLVLSTLHRNKMINFLKGDYAFKGQFGLPINSFSFVATRTLILALILNVFFLVGYFMTSSQVKKARVAMTSMLKKEPFSQMIPPRIRRGKPELILSRLKKSDQTIVQEIKSIQSSLKINAFRHMQDVMGLIRGRNVEIIDFFAREDTSAKANSADLKHEISMILTAEKIEDLKEVQKILDAQPSWSTTLDEKQLELRASGLGKAFDQ